MLVLTVYGKDSLKWHPIQRAFLDRYVRDYEHAVYLNNLSDLPGATIVGRRQTTDRGSVQHVHGLQELVKYAQKSGHHEWLALDCDCFPIDHRWRAILRARGKNAAIVRTENLDTFLHPAACYCTDKSLTFSLSKMRTLAGELVEDVRAEMSDAFPLVRTNRKNLHPIMFGIYYDLFYHHGAGSRNAIFRSDSYYGKKLANGDGFFANPDKFIDSLKSHMHGSPDLI